MYDTFLIDFKSIDSGEETSYILLLKLDRFHGENIKQINFEDKRYNRKFSDGNFCRAAVKFLFHVSTL